MEARLSQHICFKTAKKKRETCPEFQTNPTINIEDQENNLSMDYYEDSPSLVLTPPALKTQVPGKSFLFLPKMDNRSRLTSTPNQDRPLTGGSVSNYIDEAFSFSPTGFRSPPRLDKEDDVEGIRSVLFPPLQLQQNKDGQLCDSAMFSYGSNVGKRSRASELKASNSAQRSCTDLITPPASHKKQGSQLQSFQDSGIGSFFGDSRSHLGENSLPSSPLKRRAESSESMTSLESPMKRLAFVPIDNQLQRMRTPPNFQENFDQKDSLQPGSSFLNDRTFSSGCEDASCNQLLPPPIFANSIPFISPGKDSDSRQMYTSPLNSFAVDFKFAKPSIPPMKTRGRTTEKYALKILDPVSGSKAGKRYFDIVSGLAQRNLHHVVSKVFEYIRQKDVLRCSRVSRSWASICDENRFTRGKIKSLKKQYHDEEFSRGSENFNAKEAIKNALLKSPAKLGSIRNLSSGRSALGNLQARAKKTPTKKVFMPKTPSGKNHFVPAESKYEHHQGVKRSLSFGETTTVCPWCGWTAKVYDGDDHKGQCYRFECRHTFCTLCSMKYHSPNPCKAKVSTSPKDEEKTVKAGSKKSKARLKKRLLL